MNIHVINKDLGFFTQEPITVQRFHSFDRELEWCNHAGAETQETENTIYRPDDTDTVWIAKTLVCDKCGAYQLPNDSFWYDAPTEGVTQSE